MNYKEKIIELNTLRYALFDKKNASWDEKAEKYGYDTLLDDTKIDDYAKQIIDLIKSNFDNLEIDFILEQLANLGDAPCLLNDDGGHWAFSGDGYCAVVMDEPIDNWEGCFNVECKETWKDTVREALKYYVFEEDKEEE